MSRLDPSVQSAYSAIRERVQAFINERFLAGAVLDAVQPDASLLGNGIIDSTGVLEFIDFLEVTFNIQIRDEELVPENLDSIDKAVAFVHRKMGSKTG